MAAGLRGPGTGEPLMPGVLNEFARCGAIVLAYMTVWYLVALVKKDNSVVDIAWGLGAANI